MRRKFWQSASALVIAATGLASVATASEFYWKNGTGAGSKQYWQLGTGAGSKQYWDLGTGAGSRQYWENGTGPGSKSYWSLGTGSGSEQYWKYWTGPGSEHYWKYWNGATPVGPLMALIKMGKVDVGLPPSEFASADPVAPKDALATLEAPHRDDAAVSDGPAAKAVPAATPAPLDHATPPRDRASALGAG